jgi:hypothetical protein
MLSGCLGVLIVQQVIQKIVCWLGKTLDRGGLKPLLVAQGHQRAALF